MSGKQAIPFHGILAVGNTKDEAINRYRLLARGKGVSAMVDESQKMAFVTHASNKIAEMFNPTTGELDLQNDDSLLNELNLEAKASGDPEVIANHYVCESGCGLHIVYDDDKLVRHCPACTTAVASDDDEDESDEDEESEDEEDESEEDDSEEDEDEESESADDEDDEEDDDSEEDEESDEDDEDDSEEDEDEESDEEDDSDDEDDEDADAEDDDDSGEPLVIAADSKENAIEIYRQNRQGIATAATTVEVDYMVCSSAECNAHVLSEDPNLDKCPACTSELKQPEAQATAAPAAKSESSEDDEDEEDESDLSVVDEDQDDEDEEDEESESSAETGAQAPAAPAPVAAPANAEPENGGAAPVAESSEPQKENAMSETAEKITVNMLTQVNDSHEGLDLSFSGSIGGKPLWTAFYNGTPIATASKADAGKNEDIFENPAFGNAVIAGAKHVGMKATLNEMGFKGIAHEISISSVVKNLVDTEVATASENLARDRKEHAQRLMSAMATSAIGINRGFFPDIKNPIKAALWNAMSSAGVKNAEVLIDNAFKAGSDVYHTTLFAKAAEILDNPLEVQESLSKAVLGSNYMAVSESSASGATPLEQRLENFGSVTASAAPAAKPVQEDEPEESVSSDVQISTVVAGLGRRRN